MMSEKEEKPKGSAAGQEQSAGESASTQSAVQPSAGQTGASAPAATATGTASEAAAGTTPSDEATAKTGASTDNNHITLSDEDRKNRVMGIDKQIAMLRDMMAKRPDESDEDRAKRERRERSRRIVSAVGDGLMALSNLYFTTKGAPNMYDSDRQSMLKPLNARIEADRKERMANRDNNINYALKIGALEQDKAKALQDLENKTQEKNLAIDKNNREEALQPDKLREQKGKAETAEHKAKTAEEEAKNAPKLFEAKVETEKARGRAANASAASSYASANKTNNEAEERFYYWDKKGNRYTAKTEKEAIQKAMQQGTLGYRRVPTDKEVIGVDGTRQTLRTTTRVAYPMKIEKPKPQPQPQPQAKPGRSNNGYANTKKLGL